jgi:hypothetical protein
MTAELEEQVRSSLRRRADSIDVEIPEPRLEPSGVAHCRPRRLEIVAVAAGLLLFVAVGVAIALAGRETPAPTAVDGPAVGALGAIIEPGALVSMPSPWQLDRFSFMSEAAAAATLNPNVIVSDGLGNVVEQRATTNVEYEFADGSRTIQVHFYELGTRQPTITTPEPPVVEVRGTQGYYLDYGDWRYRIQWDEGGRTWDVDAYGFTSLDQLAAELGSLRWQDDAAWSEQAPRGLADAILANRDGSVGWSANGDPHLSVTPAAVRTPTPATQDTVPSIEGPVMSASRCQAPQPTTAIYMNVNATPEETQRVEAYLAQSPLVESYEYLDQQGAYEEFRELFPDSPEMVDSVSPSDLPPSFAVVADETFSRTLPGSGLTGIKTVIDGPCSATPH